MPVNIPTPEPPKEKSFVIRVILLVLLISGILFLGYFGKLVSDYYQGVKNGTVDLSDFEKGGISSLTAGEITIPEIDNSFVSNFRGDPFIGPEDAVLTIVAFEDFECPFCGRVYPIFESVIEEYSDRVRFVYRDFPLSSIHSHAQLAAEAGQCANDQGQFWTYQGLLYNNQNQLAEADLVRFAAQADMDVSAFDNCLKSGEYTSEVQEDFDNGLRAGVTGTPTFFFNGNKVSGVLTKNGFDQIIDHFLNAQ